MREEIKKKLYLSAGTGVGARNQIQREAWLKKTLLKVPKGKRILDAGAGELQYKKYCKHLNYVSQDFGQYDGVGDSSGLQTQTWDNSRLDIISDISTIPVKDKSFDAIMCIEVFEHIPHPVDAMREFSRIMKKGGLLILTVPVSSLTHFAPYYFYNGFSRYFFEKYLSEFDFEIMELSFNGNWFESLAQEMSRLPDMLDKYTNTMHLSKTELISLNYLLRKLDKASRVDKGSSELQSHGLHVLAKKK